MRRAFVTILLAAVLAAQTTRLTQVLHLVLEHDFGCANAHLANSFDGNLIADAGGPRHHHDHSHCAVCQAMATFKVSPPPAPVMLAPLCEHHVQFTAAISLPPIIHPLHTLAPRAPPVDESVASM